ncbi:16S rRNA (cytosine(967)-C(5))-methyltransferase RsmB [Candidatus Methylocalor cossyra]|uniref:16S rRNA (cytosine(967)-C(5))-methyltransferase n=1 Tax=Candidatus Methylocalor cossyra TaxID=3108543 RepID=A0ABM9NEC1_9GAMM
MNTRAIAAEVLARVVGGGDSLPAALEAVPAALGEHDRAFVQALCYGVLRWYWRLDRVLAALTRKPVKDLRLRMLALLGLYQLKYLRVKPHAAVAETVAAAGAKPWAKAFLNGVLRAYQREQARLDAAAEADEVGEFAHPPWLIAMLRRDWPSDYRALLRANNEPPPLTLRVNRLRTSRAAYLAELAAAGFDGWPVGVGDTAVCLSTPVPVDRLPGFAEGRVSVQDAAAQLAAPLLELAAGQRVLEVGAAPGGKTLHILESCPDLAALMAIDIAPERAAKIHANLARAGLASAATVTVADATRPETWWDGRPFDRILLDAPCSATGVIRRHPDIKVLRKPADIAELARLQRRLLEAVWPTLAVGGLLLYVTCSVLRQENHAQIAAFLADHPEARERVIEADFGMPVDHGRQVLTGEGTMDGFYYARLEKLSACA